MVHITVVLLTSAIPLKRTKSNTFSVCDITLKICSFVTIGKLSIDSSISNARMTIQILISRHII